MPQNPAGTRIEPPMSDPSSKGTMPDATAAADPPEEPLDAPLDPGDRGARQLQRTDSPSFERLGQGSGPRRLQVRRDPTVHEHLLQLFARPSRRPALSSRVARGHMANMPSLDRHPFARS